MKKLISAGLLAASTLPFLALSPANAAVQGCMAGATSGIFSYSDIVSAGTLQCRVGDKKYTFESTGYNGALNDIFSLSQSGVGNLNHVLNVQSATTFLNTTITLAYMVDVISPSTNKFDRYSGGVTSPDPMTTFSLALSSTPPGSTNPVSVSDPKSTTSSSSYTGSVASAAFTNTLITSGGAGATQFTNLLVQKAPPVTQTPSPLPILGASLGFGFSRRLRNRIKAAA
jgi:hypothetical protein